MEVGPGVQKVQTPVTDPKPQSSVPSPTSPAKPSFTIPVRRANLPWFKGLVYGDYGAGKTWLWGTAAAVPEMRDVLMISAEAGDLTLFDPENKIPFHLVDPIKVTDFKTVARIYDFLKLHCQLRTTIEQSPPGSVESKDTFERLVRLQKVVMPDMEEGTRIRQYRTVIIDSLTEVEAYCMAQLLGINDATRMDEEDQGAEWAEYKKQHQMVQRMIRNFRDLPMHVLFTASRAYVQDEMKRHIYSPMMTGKLSAQVQGFMDMVGYLVVGQSEAEDKPLPRRLYVQPNPRFAAKSRFSAYRGAHFDNPTMEKILRDVGLMRSRTSQPSAAPAAAAATEATTATATATADTTATAAPTVTPATQNQAEPALAAQ